MALIFMNTDTTTAAPMTTRAQPVQSADTNLGKYAHAVYQ